MEACILKPVLLLDSTERSRLPARSTHGSIRPRRSPASPASGSAGSWPCPRRRTPSRAWFRSPSSFIPQRPSPNALLASSTTFEQGGRRVLDRSPVLPPALDLVPNYLHPGPGRLHLRRSTTGPAAPRAHPRDQLRCRRPPAPGPCSTALPLFLLLYFPSLSPDSLPLFAYRVRLLPWMPPRAPVRLAVAGNRCPVAGSVKFRLPAPSPSSE